MICMKCGKELPDNAKFCPGCGNPTGNQADPAPAMQPGSPDPKPGLSKAAIVAIIAVAVLLALFIIGTCALGSSRTSSVSSAASQASPSSNAASAMSSSAASKSDASASSSSSSSKSAASSSASSSGGTASVEAVNNAKGFMMVFPANHMLAGGASDDPSPMTADQWAESCLVFVDPSSELGRDLKNNPEDVAQQNGFYEAAQYVKGAKVISSDASGVTVEVTIMGTQNTWKDAMEHTMTCYVKTNSAGLVTNVELRSYN